MDRQQASGETRSLTNSTSGQQERMVIQEAVVASCSQVSNGGIREKDQVRKMMYPEKFDGTTSVNTFLTQFTICAEHNKWDEKEKKSFLLTSLRVTEADLLSDSLEEGWSYEEIVDQLDKRFGVRNQAVTFRAMLRNRRRKKGESLAVLYQDMLEMVSNAILGNVRPTPILWQLIISLEASRIEI